jgi:hypothetical protein
VFYGFRVFVLLAFHENTKICSRTMAEARKCGAMPLTRDFKETIKARADRDPAFRRALVEEASDCLLNNDFETAKALIRDYTSGLKRWPMISAPRQKA